MKNIKNRILAIALGLLTISTAVAQSADHKWGVSLDANYKEYNGEFGNGFMKFRNPNIQPGLGLSYYISPWFDAGLSLNYGKFTHDPAPWTQLSKQPLEYKGLYTTLTARLKFYNGKLLPENAFFGPYVTAGFGFYTGKYTQPTLSLNPTFSKTNAFGLPVGIGVRVNLSARLQMYLQSTWIPTFKDDFDGSVSGKHNDKLWQHSFGFTYNFGKAAANGSSSDSKDEKAK